MFKKLIQELKNLEGSHPIAVPINADIEGYLEKECPVDECKYQFKVYGEDWENIFRDEAVSCPMCGHQSPADQYWTTEQIERAKQQAFEHIRSRIDQALVSGAQDFNRRQPRDGFIKLSLSVRGARPHHVVIPILAGAELELKRQCEKCNARYAVIGSGFFCPSCGYNSAEHTFEDSLRKVEAKIKNLEVIRKAVAEFNKDEAEVTCRSLVESGLSDCVVAFQRVCEVLYNRQPGAKSFSPNVFQRIDEGSKLWRVEFGAGYEDWLSAQQLNRLKLLFQRRHLLAHSEGIVDQKYIERSGDPNYKMGQRIVVQPDDVLELAGLIKILVKKIKQNIKV